MLDKSNFALMWRDCGKTRYKVLLTTLVEANRLLAKKKAVFPTAILREVK